MKTFLVSLINVFLILTSSLWLPFVYAVNAITGNESSQRILLGEQFVLDRIDD